MKETIPPLEQDENFVNNEGIIKEVSQEDYKLSRKLEKQNENTGDLDLELRKTDIYKKIIETQSKKETGAEPLNQKEVFFTGTAQQKPSSKLRNLGMALRVGLWGLLGLGATKANAGVNPVDSANEKKPKIENINGIEVRAGLKIRELTNTERVDWNNFIDFVQSKAKDFGGLEKLDKGNDALARSLFIEYKKINPKTSINYDIVPSVQYEMQLLKRNVQAFEERHKNPNAKNVMGYVSVVDGWFGDNTAQSKYFSTTLNQYHNNNLVSSEDLGLLNSKLETERQAKILKSLPQNVKLEKLADGYYYEDPNSGDLVKVSDK